MHCTGMEAVELSTFAPPASPAAAARRANHPGERGVSLEIGDFVDNNDLDLGNDVPPDGTPELSRRRSQTLPTTLPTSSGSDAANRETDEDGGTELDDVAAAAAWTKAARAQTASGKPALSRGVSVKNLGKVARFIGGVAGGGGNGVQRRGSVGADTYR